MDLAPEHHEHRLEVDTQRKCISTRQAQCESRERTSCQYPPEIQRLWGEEEEGQDDELSTGNNGLSFSPLPTSNMQVGTSLVDHISDGNGGGKLRIRRCDNNYDAFATRHLGCQAHLGTANRSL